MSSTKNHAAEAFKKDYTKKVVLSNEWIRLERTSAKHGKELYNLIQDRNILDHLTLEINNWEEYEDYLRFINNQWQMNQDLTYTIFTPTQQIIGQVSLYNMSFMHHRAEIGIWIGSPYHHQGFGTHALHVIIEYAFTSLHFNRIQAHIFINNRRSQDLFLKIGFIYEGLLREYVVNNDHFVDVNEYALLYSDWKFQQKIR